MRQLGKRSELATITETEGMSTGAEQSCSNTVPLSHSPPLYAPDQLTANRGIRRDLRLRREAADLADGRVANQATIDRRRERGRRRVVGARGGLSRRLRRLGLRVRLRRLSLALIAHLNINASTRT